MILEAIVTTINDDGTPNISPMGPTVNDASLKTFELRPFPTSRTFANLKRTKMGVLHITDDVEMFALAALGSLNTPPLQDASRVTGKIISDSCRWFEFQVEFIDETGPRISLNCRTVHQGRMRDFWGFNRAKHAVIEAAILATRIDFLPAEEVRDQFTRFESIIIKTGGEQEKSAFDRLSQFVGYPNGES